jgi:2-polyprenyl-6-methoxyphenol hydroxylase-like FAD-dependent oxidoreductase
MTTEPRTAAIAGAGIGGLAAGVALRRAGWTVRIHERAASPRELGFGLLLAPNALSALHELGVADAVTSGAVPATGAEIRRLNGRLIRRFQEPAGLPTLVALRSELHGALLAGIGDDVLRLGSEVVSFNQTPRAVTLWLADGSTDTADVFIGADGIRSAIRRQLHPREPPPRPSGFCAVRGVAYGVGGRLGDLAAVGYLDDGIEAATARASGAAVYWYLSLLSADLPTGCRTAAAVLDRLVRRFEPALKAIVSATKPDDMRFDELFERDPLGSWGDGRVTLLGDAAHPLLPHTGQGAAQALEDAVALGLALSSDVDSQHALRRYERVRMRRTRTFVRLGPRIARVTTTRSASIQLVRAAGIRLIPAWMIKGWGAGRRDPHRELRPR